MFTDLCIHDSPTFWPHRSWQELEKWPDKAGTLVLCPVTGHSDWALGHPLDAEELIITALLRHAAEIHPVQGKWLTLPPCRFAAGPHARTSFPVPLEIAFSHLAAWGKSVAESGFRKLVFVNASPFHEDIVDAAGRDLRAESGIQVFIINLSGLGIDLHPACPEGRLRAQTLVTSILRQPPAIGASPAPNKPGLPAGAEAPWDPPEWTMPEPLSLAEANAAAPEILARSAEHLIRLTTEILNHPPLA
ncbi:creatininase family protein [Akkermansiaceae bacterium]|nr:creatininase family protein [Akkermansiaceae bacterium]